jgi:hypothetical protein
LRHHAAISPLAKHLSAAFVSTMSNTQILDAALRLPVRQRERVAEAILGSITAPSQRHIAALWAQEAESRVDGLLKVKIKTRPGAEVLAYRGRGGK